MEFFPGVQRLRGDLMRFIILQKSLIAQQVRIFLPLVGISKKRWYWFKMREWSFKGILRSKFIFTLRMIDAWNLLLEEVVEVDTITMFRGQLDRNKRIQPQGRRGISVGRQKGCDRLKSHYCAVQFYDSMDRFSLNWIFIPLNIVWVLSRLFYSSAWVIHCHLLCFNKPIQLRFSIDSLLLIINSHE